MDSSSIRSNIEASLLKGTLQQLSILKQQSISLHDAQRAQDSHRRSLADLRNEVLRLQKRRERLKIDIDLQERQNIAKKLKTESTKGNNEGIIDKDFESKFLKEAVVVHKERLKELEQESFRLFGHSLFKLKDVTEPHIGIRIDASYIDRYVDCFYLLLTIDDDNTLKIWKHTIPAFVPLKSMEDNFLNSNLMVFLDTLDQHLSTYTYRRFDIESLRQLEGYVLESNPSFTYAKVTNNDLRVSVIFEYEVTGISPTLRVFDAKNREDATMTSKLKKAEGSLASRIKNVFSDMY